MVRYFTSLDFMLSSIKFAFAINTQVYESVHNYSKKNSLCPLVKLITVLIGNSGLFIFEFQVVALSLRDQHRSKSLC